MPKFYAGVGSRKTPSPILELMTRAAKKLAQARVRREKLITREMVRKNPRITYLFGDNLQRVGLGGQAAAMRGEPNAIGIATKKRPSLSPEDFFTDDELASNIEILNRDFGRIPEANYVVIPQNGLGSGLAQLDRRAPKTFAHLQKLIADLESKRAPFTLRSGGAEGADSAFQAGDPLAFILKPHHATNQARELASKHHPNWANLSPYVQNLMARNAQIILGQELNDPAKFVMAWTPTLNIHSREAGGTGHGLRIAEAAGIPIRNLADDSVRQRLMEWLDL
jgi:hypothetical protein